MAKTISSTKWSSIYIHKKWMVKQIFIVKQLFARTHCSYIWRQTAGQIIKRTENASLRCCCYRNYIQKVSRVYYPCPVTPSPLAKNDHVECLIILLIMEKAKLTAGAGRSNKQTNKHPNKLQPEVSKRQVLVWTLPLSNFGYGLEANHSIKGCSL